VLVVLDSGPLGLLCNARGGRINEEVRAWATSVEERGDDLVVPEIADYEVRRELVRAGLDRSRRRLDELAADLHYEPLTTAQLRAAARLWADARNAGRPTAHDHALDGDVILAAQARHLGEDVVIATTNPAHLGRYVDARHWNEI
jgi:predicted nucleic acid-binding protein